MMTPKSFIFLTVVIATIHGIIALPKSSYGDLVSKSSLSLVKRMEGSSSGERRHDDSCLCIDCYESRLNLPPARIRRGEDVVTNPVAQILLYPAVKYLDSVSDDYKKKYESVKANMIKKQYETWLARKHLRPEEVQIVYREQVMDSSRQNIEEDIPEYEPSEPLLGQQITRRRGGSRHSR